MQAATGVLQNLSVICSHTSLKRILTTLKIANMDLDTFAPAMVHRAAHIRGAEMSIQIDMPLADSDAMFGWILLDPCRLLA